MDIDNDATVTTNPYKYNTKELERHFGLESYEYGARMMDPQLGMWHVVDPMADIQRSASPYVFSLNNPIAYADEDGNLPILINGRAANDDQRASTKYWDTNLLSTIFNAGIPNPGNTGLLVDGDQYYGTANFKDYGWQFQVRPGEWFRGNDASERTEAGYTVGKSDIPLILANLSKDPSTGKYNETIQIYTHSRGAAFGAGYIQAILEYVKAHPNEFADPKNVIDLVLNIAPHQSNSLSEPGGLNAYSIDHTKDPWSGNDMKGLKAAFKTNEEGGFIGLKAHSTTSFIKDVAAFLQAFKSNGKNSSRLIKDFVKDMKKNMI